MRGLDPLQNTPSIRLAVRADDAGSFISANEAIEESVAAGLARNVSIMVPGPAFEDAARRFAGRDDICFGLHVTLNAELSYPKWGPVSPTATVASLLDDNGYFLPTPNSTMDRGFIAEEAMREVEAQLKLARRAGIKITYLDEHMGVSRIGIRGQIADLCRREGLMDVHGIPQISLGQSLAAAGQELQKASPGDYVWVTHPGFITEETRALHPEGRADDGGFTAARDAERQLLANPQLSALFRANGVQPCRYLEICAW